MCASCEHKWSREEKSAVPEETTLRATFEKYGQAAQLRKLTEELAELITAVCHLHDPHRPRGHDAHQALAEEVADVEIMLTQLRIIYPWLDNVVSMQRSIKIERLRSALAQ